MNDDVDNPAPPTEALDAGPPPTMAIDQTLRLDHVIARGNISLPSHFGRYQVLKRIGLGGFASVYAAYDPQLESEVAVKVLAENHSANTLVRRRFVAEARVARRLGNDRLIGVFDLGETDDGRPYVVMELAPRGTLRQRVVRTGRPSRDDLVRLIDELGACMSAIHAKGVVHRDIKPSNLLFRAKAVDGFVPGRLIEDDEQLVLADFGLARDISDGASALTVGGGTEGYMAPEQAATDGKPDFRADLYAATVVVAEMTTGRHPLRLDLTTADISTEMLVALTRSLSVDRDKRPATAEEWRTELGRAYADDAALRSGGPAPSAADDATATIDATRIGNPLRFATELRTDVPGTDMEAASFTPAQPAVTPAADDTPDRLAPTASSPVDAAPSAPAAPPGLAAEADAERQQAPTPTAIHPERPAAVVAAARAQAEAEAREARRKAEEKEAKRAARAA
ncbi:MAG: serine/threonine-protein kinase, partial [Actinomycetota bacterium]